MSTVSSALWVAYGPEGNVVGTIRRDDEGYTATVAGADASVGTVIFAAGIGPLVHLALPLFELRQRVRRARPSSPVSAG